MEAYSQIILIDDDHISNMISEMNINKVFPATEVISFTGSKQGLDFILSNEHTDQNSKKLLFLDINMPLMNGWELLDHFHLASENLKKQFHIFILSSSVNPADLDKAQSSSYVIDFIEKPLTDILLLALLDNIQKG